MVEIRRGIMKDGKPINIYERSQEAFYQAFKYADAVTKFRRKAFGFLKINFSPLFHSTTKTSEELARLYLESGLVSSMENARELLKKDSRILDDGEYTTEVRRVSVNGREVYRIRDTGCLVP
ncbi:hypothetical protein HYT25_02005 [Candidatus Pacearchaeota archaeon]|nr:hypothetical protein [Candidatus Pacearchaeota archaeon]